MNKFLKIGLISLFSIICLFSLWFFYLKDERENRLIKEGNVIVEKVEEFRQKNSRLPKSLEEIGLKEEEGADALYYDITSTTNYMISFGMSIDYNKTYYSDTKQWEDGSREMKE
jgi:hypothetical protein